MTTDHIASTGCIRAQAADVRLQSEVINAVGAKEREENELLWCYVVQLARQVWSDYRLIIVRLSNKLTLSGLIY